ncbi:unnamed protein product [Cyprideis torosa]|uniref:Uncharacterized protein n=1 Tax=Cyprideis torosa TaxID=163714 RepID=A0A7R8WRV1_9CRUS|nr:unnamed protein product [Cyprideis torosa]CAG0903046.1 unnamed protein product [Cyprideis torosa]
MIKYNTYCKNNPGLRAEITKSLKGSTFMDIADSYHAWCLTKKQNTGSNLREEDEGSNVQIPLQKLIINVVHPYDEYGMAPFKIELPKTEDPKQQLFLFLANAIVNCRPIHRNILSNFVVINGNQNTGNERVPTTPVKHNHQRISALPCVSKSRMMQAMLRELARNTALLSSIDIRLRKVEEQLTAAPTQHKRMTFLR